MTILQGNNNPKNQYIDAVGAIQSDITNHTPLTFPRGERGGGGENTDMRRRCAHCGSPGDEVMVGTKIIKRKSKCSTMCKECNVYLHFAEVGDTGPSCWELYHSNDYK